MPDFLASSPLSEALGRVKARLEQAARRARRSPEDIELLAVSKTVDPGLMAEVASLGIRQFGESRIQEAEKKRGVLRDLCPAEKSPRWHMIGHLQTNKARKAVALFDCIQSVDSLRLAEVLAQEGERRAQPVSCLVEVKVSNEASKQGITPDRLENFLELAARLSFLRLEGMMGMAPLFSEPEKTRPFFATLKNLFEKHKGYFTVNRPILSMGMSKDFEVAVEEGSTMVRIGSSLFGLRP